MASPRCRRFVIFRAALNRHLGEACVLGFGLGGIITIMVNRDYGLILIGGFWGLAIALLRRPLWPWLALAGLVAFWIAIGYPVTMSEEAFQQTVIYNTDGNAVTAKYANFINLQESPCGFGDTKEEALAELVKDAAVWLPPRRKGLTHERRLRKAG